MERVLRFWCKHFHGSIFRPVRGKYRCQVCLREYEVRWE